MVDDHANDEGFVEDHWFKEVPLECPDVEDRELDTEEEEKPLTPEELESLAQNEIEGRFSANLRS